MAGQEDERDGSTSSNHRSLCSSSLLVSINTVAGLLLGAATLIFIFGILNLGYSVGPVLLGTGIALFFVTLMAYGVLWVWAREKHQRNQSNRECVERVNDDCSISVINPHFNIGMPSSPIHSSIDHMKHYNSDHRRQLEDRRYYLDSAPCSGPPLTIPEDPPPSYWESVSCPSDPRTSHAFSS